MSADGDDEVMRPATALETPVGTGVFAAPPATASRQVPPYLLIASVLAVLIAVLGMFADSEASRAQVIRERSGQALTELGFLAGLRDAKGRRETTEPMQVELVQDGGASWVHGAVAAAIDDDAAFKVEQSNHVMRIEVVHFDRVDILVLRLWRQGWELRTPKAQWIYTNITLAFLVIACAGAVATYLRTLGPALLLAGMTLQVRMMLLRWPEEVPAAPSWWDALVDGPLIAQLTYLVNSLPDVGGYVLAFVAIFCAVLALIDHRSSPGSGGLGWAAGMSLMVALGSAAVAEGAMRLGLWASINTPLGATAGVLTLALWGVAGRVAWLRLRERTKSAGKSTGGGPATPSGAASPQGGGVENEDTSASPAQAAPAVSGPATRSGVSNGMVAVAIVGLSLSLGACGDGSARAGHGSGGGVSRKPTPSPTQGGEAIAADGGRRALAPVSSVAPVDAWLDLLDQRPSAVEYVDNRLWIDFGRVNALKHVEPSTLSSLRIGDVVDEHRGAAVLGRGATVVFPLDADLAPKRHPDLEGKPDLALAITLRGAMPDQKVTLLLNERPLVNLTLTETWARRTVSLPLDALRTGENSLRLHFRKAGGTAEGGVAAYIESIEVGGREAITGGVPKRGGYGLKARTDGHATVDIAPGSALAWYLITPRRARLRLDVAAVTTPTRLRVRVSTESDHAEGRAPTVLRELDLSEAGTQVELDLGGYSDIPLRIELENVAGGASDATLKVVQVDARRSRVDARRRRVPRDVYIVAVESARARELLVRNAQDPDLPNIRRVFAEGLVFERAYAAGPAAVPSHAALLSALPPASQLTPRGTFVAPSHELLFEAYSRSGFSTVGVTANLDVNEERGLSQGFSQLHAIERGPSRGNDATKIMSRLIELMDKHDSPRAGYAVLSDPQAPYDPPREFGELRGPEGAPTPHMSHMWVAKVQLGTLPTVDREGEPLPDYTEWIRGLYMLELGEVDRAIGDLLEHLEQTGTLDDVIVVLVGVHGEEFREHGSAGHGRTLYEESVHVPLVIRSPPLLAAGRVSVPVDLMDLAPTLLDLEGIDAPTTWHGESLIPVIDDPQPSPRLASAMMGDQSRAVWSGQFKFVMGSGLGESTQMLFDLEADPEEQENHALTQAIALRALRTGLTWQRAFESEWHRARWGTGVNLRAAFAIDHGI